jgi:serine/threonine-protein kinase
MWMYFVGALAVVVVPMVLITALRGGPAEAEPAGTSEAEQSAAIGTRAGETAGARTAPPPAREVPVEIDGRDAAAWRERLRASLDSKDWRKGATAFLALVELDPAALRESSLREATVATVATAALGPGDTADKMFDAMEHRLGADGLDLLYEIVRTRGASKAAKRALDTLRRPDVEPRITPALRIALELRTASCERKRTLFERAGQEGDGRALTELVILRGYDCRRNSDKCCFETDKALADAIKTLKSRLGK